MKIRKRNDLYRFQFLDEESAGRCYDMLAIYLYGKSAKTNLDKSIYSVRDIEDNFKLVSSCKFSSYYSGVHYAETYKCWRAVAPTPEGRILGKLCASETQAAEFVDIVDVLWWEVLPESLNFPEKYPNYIKLTKEWLTNQSRGPREVFTPRRHCSGKYQSQFYFKKQKYYLGRFDTEEEAIKTRLDKMKEMKLIWEI